jgi:hypothetical protein
MVLHHMKILFNSLLIVVAAGIGLAVGFALRGKSGNASATAESSTVALAPPAVSQAKPVRVFNQSISNRRNDDSPLATKLERDLSMSEGVTRWLYWLEALEKAAPADFPRLARLAQGNSTAMRFVAARWVELDARHLFDTLVAASKQGGGFPSEELARVLLDEWPKRDPEAVIAALSGAEEFGARANWRLEVAMSLVQTDVERGLRLMSEWHIESVGPRMTAITKWAAADPRHAAEFTLENPAGFASRLTMKTIAKEWARTDPGGALGFAATQPGELGSTLATTVLKEWAGQNLNEAAAWLAGTDVRTRNRLSPTFVEVWAKEDAASALSWCESNLAGSSLAQAVGGVLKGAAERDVAGAARLVAGMNPSPARAEAALAVAQKWFPESYSGKTVPPEAISWLASLDAESMKRALERVQWEWRNSDPKSMAAFLASPAGEQVPAQVYSILAQSMARKNPAEALEWASRLPEDLGLQAGSDAFYEWRRSQPETAMQWLRELPSTDARRQPFFQSAIRSMAYDPQAAEQLAAMTPTDRATARSVIEAMSLPEDRRARLLEAVRQR